MANILYACMNCYFNCAVVVVVVVVFTVYGIVATHTHTHTHTHNVIIAMYEYKCLWHNNMYMQHLQHAQQSGTVGHTEIEAADLYRLRSLFRVRCGRAICEDHFTDSCRTLGYVVDGAYHVLGHSYGFSVATWQNIT